MRTLPALALIAGTATPLTAQAVTGRVVDVDGDTALVGVAVSLADSAGQVRTTVLTDGAGAFALPVAVPGRYTLRTQHIAFQPVVSRPFEVGAGENVDVEIRLGRAAIALEPLVVRARRKVGVSYLRDYYARVEENRKMGRGRILTRDDLHPLEGLAVNEAVRREMIRFTDVRGFQCSPTYYWNGMAIGAGAVANMPISNVEGIEIYRRNNAPPRYANGCAAILVWSRPVRPGEGHPHNWVIMAAGVGLFALLTLALR